MATRTILACPNCQTKLDIRTERLGSELECKQCHHKFVASAPIEDGVKVDVECPGCHRDLKVRPRYLGRKVVCTHCDRGFLAQAKPVTEVVSPAPVETDDLRRSVDELDRAFREFVSNSGRTVERLEQVETRLEAARLRDTERDLAADRAGLLSDQQHLDVASIATDLATLRSEGVTFRERDEADWADRRRDFLTEVLARVDEDRERSRFHQGAMAAEIEAIRAQNADLERRAVEAESRTIGLESKLGLAEASVLAAIDRINRLEAGFREVEAAEAQRVAAFGQLDGLRDQVQVLQTEIARQAEEALNGFSDVRDEQLAGRGAHAEHLGRHQALQTGLARLEALGLAEALSRLGAIESENAGLGQAWQSLKRDQDRIRDEASVHMDRTNASLAGLSARIEALPLVARATSGAPPAAPAPRSFVDIVQTDLDLMAEDLILDRLVTPIAPVVPSSISVGTPTTSIGTNSHAASAISDAEFVRLTDKYTELMNQKKYDEAIRTARSVVDFTQDHTGELSLKHALWLRHLGVGLLKRGDQAAAQIEFHRALEICEDQSHLNRAPHAVCLLDLADSYFLGGDRRKANTFCQTAMEVLESVGGPDHSLSQRAQACLSRIKADEPTPSPTETVSVMA